MASAVFSRRSRLFCCAVIAADRNKTITSCLILGGFFSASTSFFRSFEQEIDTALDLRVMVLLKMQFRDMPETESSGQFVTQVMPGVVERRERFLLLVLGAGDGYPHGSVPPVMADLRLDDFYRQQARIAG